MTNQEWAREYEARYIFACYLYYYPQEGVESPLDDDAFDRVQNVLEAWFHLTTRGFQKRAGIVRGALKAEAHAIQYSDDEKRRAVAWATACAEAGTLLAAADIT